MALIVKDENGIHYQDHEGRVLHAPKDADVTAKLKYHNQEFIKNWIETGRLSDTVANKPKDEKKNAK